MGSRDEMRAHPFLQGMAPEIQDEVIGCAREACFAQDRLIFSDGDPADEFFLLQRGAVSVELYLPNRADHSIITLGGGDLLGWSWMTPPYRWTFDVRTLKETRAFAVDARCIRGKCEVNHEFAYQLQTRIIQVMAKRMKSMRLQFLDVYAHD